MKKKYKIAIYAICKDELKFLDGWIKSMWEADYICVLDTGSTDGTYEKLLELQKQYPEKVFVDQKTYKPWRFDTPRNDSMKLVPEDTDIYFCTDLDELLEPGWYDDIQSNWDEDTNRGSYVYAWSHTESGDVARTFWYDKIHTKGFKWVFPVHEILLPEDGVEQKLKMVSTRVLLHHYPDYAKSRSSYLDLLKLRLSEHPNEEYTYLYIAQEYFLQGDYQKSLDFALNFALTKAFYSVDGLFVPTLLLIIGDDYYALEQFELSERAYQMSIAAFPMYRDSYIALAALYMRTGRMVEAKDILYQSLQKTKKLHSWLERDLTWTYLPYDLLSQIHYTLGEIQQATDFAYLAYQMEPSLERLRVNYEILKNEIKTEIKCDLQSREELEQAFKQRQVKKEEVN